MRTGVEGLRFCASCDTATEAEVCEYGFSPSSNESKLVPPC